MLEFSAQFFGVLLRCSLDTQSEYSGQADRTAFPYMCVRTGAPGVYGLRIGTGGFRSLSDPTRERARTHLEKAIAMGRQCIKGVLVIFSVVYGRFDNF